MAESTVQTWDKRIPAADCCVLSALLDRRARETPDCIFALFDDGRCWTYRETQAMARRAAAGLGRLGVTQGDLVFIWLPNGPQALQVWFAISHLGAVCVPLNTGYRGRLLEHVIADAGGRVLVAQGALVPRLKEIRLGSLSDVVVVGAGAEPAEGLRFHGEEVLAAPEGDFSAPERPVAPWDTHAVIYTSGTTGPSKGVMTSYVQTYSSLEQAFPYVTAADRCLANLPLFHVAGIGAVYLPLMRGGSTAVVGPFAATSFWSVIRRTQATTATLVGAMASLLVKQPPAPDDRNHPLRYVLMVPLNEDTQAFASRFGCDIYTAFNMTEISTPLMSAKNPTVLGACGRPRRGVELRIVDDNDCEVSPGTVGELIVRSDRPWALTHGYLNNPAATARAWRNGWFHTGDAFRVDQEGNYYFVDRLKDAIRHRGENISSFEVEAEVCAHPAVREAAAVAVRDEHGEEEVLVALCAVPGMTIDPAALIGFLIPRMPHFMVPRFVRLLEELPKTSTLRVQKHLLRAEGVTPDTFDRVRAGISLKSDRTLA
jgi:carnitine-CoA ligase